MSEEGPIEIYIGNGLDDDREIELSPYGQYLRSRLLLSGFEQFLTLLKEYYPKIKSIIEKNPFIRITKFNFDVPVLKEAEDISFQLSTRGYLYDPVTNNPLHFPSIEMDYLEFERQVKEEVPFIYERRLLDSIGYLRNIFIKWCTKQEEIVRTTTEKRICGWKNQYVQDYETVDTFEWTWSEKAKEMGEDLKEHDFDDFHDADMWMDDMIEDGMVEKIPKKNVRMPITRRFKQPIEERFADFYVSGIKIESFNINHLYDFNMEDNRWIAFDLENINFYKRDPIIFCPANGYCFLLYDTVNNKFHFPDTYPLLDKFYNMRKKVMAGDKIHYPFRNTDIVVKPERWVHVGNEEPVCFLESNDQRLTSFYRVIESLLPDGIPLKSELVLEIGDLLMKDLKINSFSIGPNLKKKLEDFAQETGINLSQINNMFRGKK